MNNIITLTLAKAGKNEADPTCANDLNIEMPNNINPFTQYMYISVK